MADRAALIVRFWRFRCPECGMGDQELGRLAEAHDVHCDVCLNETGERVRLRRWAAEDGGAVACGNVDQAA